MPYSRRSNRDPSVTLEGEYKQLERSDIIVFELPLFGKFRLAFIVTVPPEGQTKAPVYVKFRWENRPSAGRGPQTGRRREGNGGGVVDESPTDRDPTDIRYDVGENAHEA